MSDINDIQEQCFRLGKILVNVISKPKRDVLATRFEYIHMLCGTKQEDKLSNILFMYRCPYCDKHMFKKKEVLETSIVDNVLNDLYLIQNSKETKVYDSELEDIMKLVDGWIKSIEDIKTLDGLPWLLENNKYVGEIPKWKEKL